MIISAEMRRYILPGTFFTLVAALYLLWQHRFERSPEFSTVHLSDLRANFRPAPGVEWQGSESQPELRLRVDPVHPRSVVTRLEMPGMQAMDLLHLRLQLAATHLIPGKRDWDDGRCIIEWHAPTGAREWENNPIASARFNHLGDVVEWVTSPDHPPAIPALRVENLGIAGDFVISRFEATVIRETLVWKIGRWVVMAAWLAWALAWIGYRATLIRSIIAATVWLVMGLCFVVPGPWKLIHSFGSSFAIGTEVISLQKSPAGPPLVLLDPRSDSSTPLESVGEIPDQGDFTLRLKRYATHARPFLHIILLWGPTLLIACLVGGKPARSLAVILALAIEAAQLAFGYGFDWVDAFDLVCDAIGIVLALRTHQYLKQFTPWIAKG